MRNRIGTLLALALLLGTGLDVTAHAVGAPARTCCCPATATAPLPVEHASLQRSSKCAWSRCCAAPSTPQPAPLAALSSPAPEGGTQPLLLSTTRPTCAGSAVLLAPIRPRATAPPRRPASAILLAKQSFLL